MNDQILSQILIELKSIKQEQETTNQRFSKFEEQINNRFSKFEEQTKDIPIIKQAVLETLEITKQVDSNQKSFERKVTADLNTHGHSIDILNRRQLKLEADIKTLQNR